MNNKMNIEATVPLYISNICDSNCAMCNMNKANHELSRKKLSKDEIMTQLRIIIEIEKVSSLLILSGELKKGSPRDLLMENVIFTINAAIDMGFEKISLNIGALCDEEICRIYSSIPKNFVEKLGLSVFQESYDVGTYRRYFGYDIENIPKSNYNFRLSSCERWVAHGFKRVNIGILIGLDNTYESIEKLIAHYEHLKNIGADVEISLPRIVGRDNEIFRFDDGKYIEIVKYISKRCSRAKIVITTREPEAIIAKLIDYIDVISPGTSEVGGYTESGMINNSIELSQFSIEPKRKRPSWILDDIMSKMKLDKIKYYNK